ncbi:ATP-binding protein [Eisenibacter elegans]|jgi:signal transduction histidine kinase/DNA-binding NarL/FixJ family response regulator|uniref:ATP-binding protein n=1 Tax=Eisenibacter elegans TaxID=997 RepID=UPI000479F275|nr:ATP-binding protein [Eisenibacter elegans]
MTSKHTSINLHEYKTTLLAQRCQYIVFDAQSTLVLDSCHTIVDLRPYKSLSFYALFPFLESVQEHVNEVTRNLHTAFKLPRVEFSFPFDPTHRPYLLDFVIEPLPHAIEEGLLLCTIEHNEEAHRYMTTLQQQRRETSIEKDNLLVKNEELQRLERLKTNFFSEVSHELRTPLNGIIGLSELLLEVINDAKQVSYIRAIRSSSKHLQTILNDVLDVSKIEAGKLSFERVSFSLSEVLEYIKLSFRPKLLEKGLRFVYDIDPLIPDQLTGDKVRFTQILFNLVGNAVKFTQEGYIRVQVGLPNHIPVNDAKFWLEVAIEDTGIGIAPAQLPHIFTPYQQASDSITRLFGGTGLGLTIVKQLVEMQGGFIEVYSAPQVGTNFHFALPFVMAETEVAEIETHPKLNTKLATDERFLPFQNSPRVLLVDDNEVNLLYTQKVLQDWGCMVETAIDGQCALEKLRRQTYHALLLDIQMPVVDGWQVARVLHDKPNPEYPLPIIGLSAFGDGANQHPDSKFFNAFLDKPFAKADLYDTLCKLLPARFRRLIDTSYLREIALDNHQFLRDAAQLFETQSKLELRNIDEAFHNQHWRQLADVLHKMKSNIRMMGMYSTEKIITQLEHHLSTEAMPNNLWVQQQLKNLRKAFMQAQTELAEELENLH